MPTGAELIRLDAATGMGAGKGSERGIRPGGMTKSVRGSLRVKEETSYELVRCGSLTRRSHSGCCLPAARLGSQSMREIHRPIVKSWTFTGSRLRF